MRKTIEGPPLGTILASKHDQNRAEKRDRLLRAAVEAFTEAGFENTTVSDIVRRAGMTPSTFYNYYRDKDALREEMLEGASARMLQSIAGIRRRAGGVHEYVALACRGLFAAMILDGVVAALLRRNLPLLRSLVDAPAMAPVYEAMKADLGEAIRAGKMEAIDLDLATALLKASLFEVAVVLLTQPRPDLEGGAQFLTRAMVAALGLR